MRKAERARELLDTTAKGLLDKSINDVKFGNTIDHIVLTPIYNLST